MKAHYLIRVIDKSGFVINAQEHLVDLGDEANFLVDVRKIKKEFPECVRIVADLAISD